MLIPPCVGEGLQTDGVFYASLRYLACAEAEGAVYGLMELLVLVDGGGEYDIRG